MVEQAISKPRCRLMQFHCPVMLKLERCETEKTMTRAERARAFLLLSYQFTKQDFKEVDLNGRWQ